LPWIEQAIEANATANWKGQRVFVRAFKVWGCSREKIIYHPKEVVDDSNRPMPDYGSLYEGCYLDSYSVNGIGSGIYEAFATYSTEDQRYQIQSTFQTETIQMPFSERGVVVLPVGTPVGPTSGVQYGWDLKYQPILISVNRIIYSVYYTTRRDLIAVDSDQIFSLVNRLMKPFGVNNYYRFEGVQMSLVGSRSLVGGPDTYLLNYSWVRDSGIPLPVGVVINRSNSSLHFPDGSASQLPDGNTRNDWIIPPFHSLIGYRDDVLGVSGYPDLTAPHKFVAVCRYAFDRGNERSYTSLPGLGGAP
jgi:hypothetical protein